jgi:hypothetical protein
MPHLQHVSLAHIKSNVLNPRESVEVRRPCYSLSRLRSSIIFSPKVL